MTTEQHTLAFNKYYIDIQNYFNSTNSTSQEFDFERQVNSSKRSHSKLSTLTETQFLELSTDVHDELQRRLNSNNEHVETCLKPIEAFHKKRNIAREKLSLLSENRFNDLLNDIVQEIEKRGYYINDVSNVNEDCTNELNDIVNQDIKDTSTPLKKIPSIDGDTTNNISKEDNIQQTIVVPVKASINWSSDEEEEEEEEEDQNIVKIKDENEETIEDGKPISVFPDSTKELDTLNQKDIENKSNVIKNHQSKKVYNDSSIIQTDENLTEPRKINTSENDITSTHSISENKDIKLTPTTFEQPENEIHSKDSDEFDFNTPLTTMLMNKETTTETLVMNESDSKNIDLLYTDSKKEIELLKNENLELRKELESLKNGNNNNDDNIRQKIILNRHNLQFDQYIDPSGHIPLNLVKNFHNLITHLYSIINESDYVTNKEELGRHLFTKTFQISKNLREVMLLSAVPDVENEIILLRTSLSHLITSIRYYCSFNDLLPKITVNTTISDLCFSFCNLVSVVKIKSMDSTNTKISDNDFILNPNEATLVNYVDTEEMLSPNLSSKVKPLRLAEKFHAFENPTSPVDNNYNNASVNEVLPKPESSISNAARSTPNKGLLYERIDVKSVAPSQEKKEHKRHIQMKMHKSGPSTIEEKSKRADLHNNETKNSAKKEPERSRSFMDRFKKDKIVDRLKHIGAK